MSNLKELFNSVILGEDKDEQCLIKIVIEREYCCRSSDYFKVEIEEYELKDEFIDMFKNGKEIRLIDGQYNNCNFFYCSTKFIPISKSEYEDEKNKVIDTIC